MANFFSYPPPSLCPVSCSADMTIKLWETQEYNCVKTFTGHEHNVSSAMYDMLFLGAQSTCDSTCRSRAFHRFSSNGRLVFSCSRDNTVRVWDVATGFAFLFVSSLSALIHAFKKYSHTRMIPPLPVSYPRVCKRILKGHSEWVRCLATSSGSGLIASGAMDKVPSTVLRDSNLYYEMKCCAIDCAIVGSEQR